MIEFINVRGSSNRSWLQIVISLFNVKILVQVNKTVRL